MKLKYFIVIAFLFSSLPSSFAQTIASGYYHNLSIHQDGSLWSWGYNRYGQLGDGTTNPCTSPIRIGNANNWKTIAAGYYHSVAIKTDGSLWTWGGNGIGQLGDGTAVNANSPKRIGSATDWQMVGGGYNHTVAIKNDGSLWTWGYNNEGQLGDGTFVNKSIPTRVGNSSDWKLISVGGNYTLAIKNDGTLWAWGWNGNGELGDGTRVNKNIPTQIGSDTDWKIIESGITHTLAIKTNGSLWAWGWNGNGQLGNGLYNPRTAPTRIGTDTDWQSISAGYANTLAIKNNGSLWAWGDNSDGQLGNGTIVDEAIPTRIGIATNWALVSNGFYHTLTMKNNGELWTWGYNLDGQLGNGFSSNKGLPMKLDNNDWRISVGGYNHTVAIKNDGSLWSWGQNTSGQLGDGTLVNKTTPAHIGTDTDWQMLSAGSTHTVAIKNNGSLWSWGLNNLGQLGDGTNNYRSTPGRVGTGTDWRSVSTGTTHTVAIKNNGSLWAWGANDVGQLGDGTYNHSYSPIRIGVDSDWQMVSVGSTFTIAIKNDGSLWVWGANDVGQLGDGTYIKKNVPTKIGTDADWQMVSAGLDHTLAIKKDGSLWAWGLHDGSQVNSSSNVHTRIGTDSDWQMASAGYSHLAAIKKDGSLWAWGFNSVGQLGDGTYKEWNGIVRIGTDSNWQMVSLGTGHTVATKSDGSLWTWGANSYGQLGMGFERINPTPINIYFNLIYTTPTPTGDASQSICSPLATISSLRATGTSIKWYDVETGGFPLASSTPLVDNKTYYASQTINSLESKSRLVVTVTVALPTATITAGGATIFCLGDKVTLMANAGSSYLWSTGATTQSIEVGTSGNYTVSVTNASGCSDTSIATTVTVNPLPTATITSDGPISFCFGNKVTLTSSEGSSYFWSTGASTRSIEVSTSGNYTVSVTNANRCSATSTATTVTVNPLPTATITASGSTALCEGGKITLTSSEGSSYLWSTGATTRSIEVSAAGNYTVSVTNASGCIVTSTATTVTVNPLPTATITAGGPTSFCFGDKVTLTSSEGSSYLWSTGASTRSIEVSTSGNYTVSVTNASGCIATSTATTVTVNPLPTATITASASTKLCQGEKVILTSSEGSKYLWSTGAITRSIEVSTTGNYTVSVTNSNGCIATSTASTVTVSPLPSARITASGSTALCEGGKVILTSSEGSSYLWSTGANTRSIGVSTAGDYTVIVTNGNGCIATSAATTVTVNPLPVTTITASGSTILCQGEKVTLTSSEGSSYLWSTGAITRSIEVSTSGEYTVSMTNANGCTVTSTATTVRVNSIPTARIIAGGPTSFCLGGMVTLTASFGSSYLWSTGATSQSIEVNEGGNYTVRVSNSNGCSVTSAVTTVTVSAYPAATITVGGSTTITQTGNVVLSANTGSGLTYKWIRNGVAINAATASSYTASTFGSYTVKVSNATGCETLSSATVIKSVLVLPANNYQINIQGETCRASDNGKITITAVQNLSYTATLSKSGQTVKTANFNTNTDLTNLPSGNYTLCLTVPGQTEYKQCFDLTITEPLDLSVYSKVNPTNNTIDLLMSGGDTYYITLNEEKYTSYTSKMSLGLKAGLNKITVNSSQICQGLYTEEIYVNEKILAYPNPFKSLLNLKIENQENKELLVRIVDRYGLSVYEAKNLVINNLVTLDLSNLNNDYYFVVIGKQTFKVIKQ